jgi:large subunit ribosomal protein L6
MSRIGRQPVVVPQGVQVEFKGQDIRVKGPLGELHGKLPVSVKAELKNGQVVLTSHGEEPGDKANYGTSRARLANMVQGVSKGFQKVLEIYGLGYRATLAGPKLSLTLGFSHPVEFDIPKGVKVEVDPKQTVMTLTCTDKELLGATAARLRGLKEPEPYKATGIRYRGEHIVRKAGKTAAGAGTGAGGGGAKK